MSELKLLPAINTHPIQGAIDRILELGDLKTPDDIREWAQRMGATGEPDSATECVLANVIRGDLPAEVYVCGDEIKITMNDPVSMIMKFETTEAVYEFIDEFDGGMYPELIERKIEDQETTLLILDEVFPVQEWQRPLLTQVVAHNRTEEVLAHVR